MRPLGEWRRRAQNRFEPARRLGVDTALRRRHVCYGRLLALCVLVMIQALNGMLLPIILVFMLLLINDDRLMGDLKNSRLANILGWGTFAFVSTAVLFLLGSQALGWLGISLFSSGGDRKSTRLNSSHT